MDHLLIQSTVIYFYLDYEIQETLTLLDIIRSLLKQEASQLTVLPPSFEKLYNDSNKTSRPPKLEVFMELLLDILQGYHIFTVIDAVDEASEATQHVLYSLFFEMQTRKMQAAHIYPVAYSNYLEIE